MSGWQSRRIGDLGRVVTGKTPPASQPEMFSGPIPFLTPTDMGDDLRHVAVGRTVSAAWDPKLRLLLPSQSVAVVCIGATIGKVCLTSEPTHTNQQLNSIIVDRELYDPFFVYYAVRLKVDELKARAAGAATPIINKSAFSDVTLRLPSLFAQRRIAAILSAYDDLIEVNRRRVAVLEEMARGLFEEWFVRFRCPGHEDIDVVHTSNGPKPTTWKHVRLDDILVLQRGYDLPTSARSPGPFSVISASGRHGAHAEAKVKGPGVVTGRSGTIGKVHLVFDDHWPLNTTLYVKQFKLGGPAFACQLLRKLNLASMSGGAAVPTLNRNHVHGLQVAVPPRDILDKFEDVVMNWLNLAHNLESQIEGLSASRDLLLPRLISGQLSVGAAERDLMEAA